MYEEDSKNICWRKYLGHEIVKAINDETINITYQGTSEIVILSRNCMG